MRDYSKVAPRFWTGGTGKLLRGDPMAQLVALYLMTSPHAAMNGVYNLPVTYMAAEIGIPIEGALKGLNRCCDEGFCVYEWDEEVVFVVEMASHQVGDDLKDGDKRLTGVKKQYESIQEALIKQAFFDRYGKAYRLIPPTPLEAPCKPLRSQKQEQKQEQEKEQEQDLLPSPVKPVLAPADVLGTLPLNDGSDFPVSKAQAKEFQKLYPAVDVVQQFRAMKGWLMTNPKKRKTKNGIMRFVNSWLAKEQDKGGSGNPGTREPPPLPRMEA